ncbi:MAG TPA: BTAD domain-containing putative transcriptional regulator, partial [Gemmatimonadaceae bacterium]|nr:BTAD domain-containing putative transcriptional regulator [Gemmatimonadaceae bacterium]
MLRLRLLGSRELERTDRGDASAVFAQPKRFALLAYLACRADRFHRRDTLLAVFWPELDTFGARRALRNALYHLRQALGEDAFVARGDEELMIDRTKLWCDVTALGESLAEGRYDEAVALYRGELLEGVHVSGVGEEFEDWLVRERAQALERVLRALEQLCKQQESAGKLAAAAQTAVRATQLAPYDEAWVRRAVVALHSSGDRGGAFTLFENFARQLGEEFDASPNSETVALIDRLRLGAEPIPLIVAAAPPSSPGSSVAPEQAPAPSPPPALAPTAKRSHRVFAALAVATLLVLAGGAYLHARPQAQTSPRRRVIVSVFANRTGDKTLDPIADMMIDWVTRGMLTERAVDVVDPRALYARGRDAQGQPLDAVLLAQHNGANIIIDGSYYRSGDSLLFTANLLDASGHVLRSVGPLSTSISTPAAGVEATRARVMMSLASLVDPRLSVAWDAGRAPPAYDAYVPYIAGLDQFWSGQYARAESSFALSARRDSTFDAAAIALAMTAANITKCDVVDSLDRAMSARNRALSKVDYLTLRISITHCHGQNEEMYRLATRRAQLMSVTSPFQISAASTAMWANHPAAAVKLLERIDPAVDLDWMPDPNHSDYWDNLLHAYHLLGRHADELATAQRLDRPDGLNGILMRAQALAGLGRADDALRVMDSSLTRPWERDLSNGMAPDMDGRDEYRSSAAWVVLWTARELDVHGSIDAARTAAAHGVAWCDGRPPRDRSAPEIRFFKALLLEEAGSFDSAQAIMRALVAEDSSEVDFRGIMAGLSAEQGDTATALRLDDWLAHRTSDADSWGPTYYRARVATLLGRPANAVALVRMSLERGAWPLWIHIDPVLHRLAPRADYRTLTLPR